MSDKNNSAATVVIVFGFVFCVLGMGGEGTFGILLILLSIVLFIVGFVLSLGSRNHKKPADQE